MPREVSIDPLGTSADPRRYVPIPTSERALAALQAGICAGRSPLLLQGPSGVGKTLLLRVLAEREMRAGRRVLFSPFLHLPPEDVAPWLYHLVGWPRALANASDAELVDALRAHGLRTTLLIVDEIQSATPASARRLTELASAAGPTLQLVTAGRSRGDRLTEELRPAATILLDGAFPPAELRTLCDAFLARAGVPLALKCLSPEERGRIAERARGVPALLVAELLRYSADIEVHGGVAAAVRPESGPPSFSRVALREPAGAHAADVIEAAAAAPVEPPVPVAWSPPLVWPRPPAAASVPPPKAASPRLRAAALGFARAEGARAITLSVSAASALLRVFALLLALLALLAHALRARLLLGADRGSERLAQLVRAAADGLLRVIARVDALSARWDAVGAPAWDQLARDVRATGERALWLARAEEARAEAAARTIGIRAREIGLQAAASARVTAIEKARRARLEGQRASAAARLASAAAVARARAFPLQLAAWIAHLPSPRVPLSQHQVLIAASFVAVLALHIGGARDDSAVAAPAPSRPPAVVASLPDLSPAAPTPPIRVRVNARPWAFIRVDGVAVGPTPLSHLHLAEGPHEFEAEFADGRRLKQEVVIGPEQRWVSLR